MTMAACYDLQLECDGDGCDFGDLGTRRIVNITGELGSSCRRRARKAGWKMFAQTGHCLCPGCVARGAKVVE